MKNHRELFESTLCSMFFFFFVFVNVQTVFFWSAFKFVFLLLLVFSMCVCECVDKCVKHSWWLTAQRPDSIACHILDRSTLLTKMPNSRRLPNRINQFFILFFYIEFSVIVRKYLQNIYLFSISMQQTHKNDTRPNSTYCVCIHVCLPVCAYVRTVRVRNHFIHFLCVDSVDIQFYHLNN